ncbi:MAG: integrase core domain-containing protein [Ktedonobacterales bacterium]
MSLSLLTLFSSFFHRLLLRVRARFLAWIKPAGSGQVLGSLTDLARSKSELVAENALLRQQLIVLRRSVKRPTLTRTDRVLMVLLARRIRAWRQALLIIKPDTLLRWHRAGFRLFWRRTSKVTTRTPRVSAETIALIAQMAVQNQLWGAERIRGELLKLGTRLSKRTIQKYLRRARPPRPKGQEWSTFLRNHAHDIWSCDFVEVTGIFFRPIYAFVLLELATRRVVHVNVTRHPTDAWVAQQLREATPFDQRPKYLIRDNDAKFGPAFARVAAASSIEVLRTPYRAPRANAIRERFLGSLRRECLDHVPILNERQFWRVLHEYITYFNGARPHQGIRQQRPDNVATSVAAQGTGQITAIPVLGGLHHDYQRAA